MERIFKYNMFLGRPFGGEKIGGSSLAVLYNFESESEFAVRRESRPLKLPNGGEHLVCIGNALETYQSILEIFT